MNTAIALVCAEGIVKSADGNLLACNGGHISITKDWGKNILHRMGLVKLGLVQRLRYLLQILTR